MSAPLEPGIEKAVKGAYRKLWGKDWPAHNSDSTLRDLARKVVAIERARCAKVAEPVDDVLAATIRGGSDG